ncbi:MAG TPA: efflux RND transporter periplasmic adaptor subunit [Candidatus Didemnitutus sp.]|nr:efflux RND transporter periplasmic adaptor subunit [Candidatus Didemnitutus sp.]
MYYTCSMHPQVVGNEPGWCPICGMALIQVKKSVTNKPNELRLSNEQVVLGNISVDTIRMGSLNDEVVLTATLNIDQTATSAISARIGGRIERLYFKSIGDYVQKGDKIFDLYSEELNALKQEYILILNQLTELGNSMVDYRQLALSAKNKLLLWGMQESQIKQLEQSRTATSTTAFFSNSKGYITTLDIKEGDYVMDGSPIMQLASLSTLWAEAQVYASQLADINLNGESFVQLPDLDNLLLRGKIEFINPEINPDTRINLLRVSIPNSKGVLRPGMAAYVIIRNPARNTLSLPTDAVLRDSRGATVWVQTAKNTFELRMVQTGLETGNRIEITSGIQNGDVVVLTGAYLLNSEFIFKNQADPMAGMKM